MRRYTHPVILVIVFLLGCATSQVSQSLLAPPARAQAGASVQRWEYACVSTFDPKKLADWSNEAGTQGWEMVAGAGGLGKGESGIGTVQKAVWCFKRPAP